MVLKKCINLNSPNNLLNLIDLINLRRQITTCNSTSPIVKGNKIY